MIVLAMANEATWDDPFTITLAGVEMSKQSVSDGTAVKGTIAFLRVPAGTTADITITYTGSFKDISLVKFVVFVLNKLQFYNIASVDTVGAFGLQTWSGNVSCSDPNAVIISVINQHGVTGLTTVWTGLTEVSDADSFKVAYKVGGITTPEHPVSYTHSSATIGNTCGIAAVFR
jgi:hypothetical protein